jgi:hypothetical protein
MVERTRAVGMPGWVKAFIGLGLLAIAAMGIMMLWGHGPWQHGAVPGGDYAVTLGMHG